MSIEIGISDDYAVLYGPGFKFYYGYEKTNDNGEWLFTAELNGFEMDRTAKELGLLEDQPVEEVLLKGIGEFISEIKDLLPHPGLSM